jgi:hypothetical protein
MGHRFRWKWGSAGLSDAGNGYDLRSAPFESRLLCVGWGGSIISFPSSRFCLGRLRRKWGMVSTGTGARLRRMWGAVSNEVGHDSADVGHPGSLSAPRWLFSFLRSWRPASFRFHHSLVLGVFGGGDSIISSPSFRLPGFGRVPRPGLCWPRTASNRGPLRFVGLRPGVWRSNGGW